jgi:hypothetical protein
MGDYNDNPKNEKKEIVEKQFVEKKVISQEIDLESISNAIINAVNDKLNLKNGIIYQGETDSKINDSFDSSKSLDKLAESMLVSRGNKNANFDDLGDVKETKSDKESTNKTIDLLRGLED